MMKSAKTRTVLALVVTLMVTALLIGYTSGRGLAATAACGQIARAFQNHRQTIYDPETDTITVVDYDAEEDYRRKPVSFNAAFALKECKADEHVTTHVKVVREENQHYEAALCDQLRRVISGKEPVPVKHGQSMNMDAAKRYLAERCTESQMPGGE